MRGGRRTLLAAISALALGGSMACAGRLTPLTGTLVPTPLPDTRLVGPRRVIFRWEYEESSLGARGEGVASVTPGDSARVDLFLAGGLGSAVVFLFGDSVIAPTTVLGSVPIPPPAFFWAALGVLGVTGTDTVVRVDGDNLRADIEGTTRWRATFQAARLTRLERYSGGALAEWIAQEDAHRIRYRQTSGRRTLTLEIMRTEEVSGFDPAIWYP